MGPYGSQLEALEAANTDMFLRPRRRWTLSDAIDYLDDLNKPGRTRIVQQVFKGSWIAYAPTDCNWMAIRPPALILLE